MRTPLLVATALLLGPMPPVEAAAAPMCLGRRATIVGTSGDDVLRGGRRDVVVGLGGNDVIAGSGRLFYACGNGGDDEIRGGPEQDHLQGGRGDDRLYGSHRTDRLFGGAGNDVLVGDSSKDRDRGGPDELFGGPGHDRLYGFVGHDVLDGSSGDDQLRGGDDNDDLTPGPGDDLVQGGYDHGSDEVLYAKATESVTVDLSAGTATGEGTDVVREVETVVGSVHDDSLTGSAGPDALYGMNGNDVLSGLGGDDYLAPDVTYHGLTSYSGSNDVLFGGEGRDQVVFSTHMQVPLSVDLTTGDAIGEGVDELSNVEDVFAVLADLAVTVVGDAEANGIYTGSGDDDVRAGAGDDFVHVNLGEDSVDGEDGVDTCVDAELVTNCEA